MRALPQSHQRYLHPILGMTVPRPPPGSYPLNGRMTASDWAGRQHDHVRPTKG